MLTSYYSCWRSIYRCRRSCGFPFDLTTTTTTMMTAIFLCLFFFIAGRIFATCASEFLCGFSDLCSILFFFLLFPRVKVIARFFHNLVLFPRVFPLAIPLLFFFLFFFSFLFYLLLFSLLSSLSVKSIRFMYISSRARKILCYCNT